MLVAPLNSRSRTVHQHIPYCQCWNKKCPVSCNQLDACKCGEDNSVQEWGWDPPDSSHTSSVLVSENKKQVTFHPLFSTGTAAAKGDTPLHHNYHYYWEVKILTETYGTDIMVGLATDKVNTQDSKFKFTSLLGRDGESYGLSYTGAVRHDATVARDSTGFGRGSIVGVRVDMWHGTLEFFVNRKPQGVSFYNLRRHRALFPMVCSTAAQSSMRLIYTGSWRASLLVDAAKILAASVKETQERLPPGLLYTCRSQFWLTLPSEGCEEKENFDNESIGMGSMKMPTDVEEGERSKKPKSPKYQTDKYAVDWNEETTLADEVAEIEYSNLIFLESSPEQQTVKNLFGGLHRDQNLSNVARNK